MTQLVEAAGRLVANRNVPGSRVTAPSGTIDDTGRVELSSEVVKKTEVVKELLRGRPGTPMKKGSRVLDLQKNNQNSFTGVPEMDMRGSIWSPAMYMQQPPLGRSHLILGDSLVRILQN